MIVGHFHTLTLLSMLAPYVTEPLTASYWVWYMRWLLWWMHLSKELGSAFLHQKVNQTCLTSQNQCYHQHPHQNPCGRISGLGVLYWQLQYYSSMTWTTPHFYQTLANDKSNTQTRNYLIWLCELGEGLNKKNRGKFH